MNKASGDTSGTTAGDTGGAADDHAAGARRLWAAIEPVHLLTYFAPEVAGAAAGAGLKGWWMGYVAGRAAPLGAAGPAPVTAMFHGFAPRLVERALPDAWTYAAPDAVLRARLYAVRDALARALPPGSDPALERLAGLLEAAVAGCDFGARPLAAAWAAVRLPGDLAGEPSMRFWLAGTVLREHRGDGHVLALAHHGLSGVEAVVTHAATGTVATNMLQARGWTEAEWADAQAALAARGLLDDSGGCTTAGRDLRARVEADTDRLAAGPVRRLGPGDLAEIERLALPLGRHLGATGDVPYPNPVGVPRP